AYTGAILLETGRDLRVDRRRDARQTDRGPEASRVRPKPLHRRGPEREVEPQPIDQDHDRIARALVRLLHAILDLDEMEAAPIAQRADVRVAEPDSEREREREEDRVAELRNGGRQRAQSTFVRGNRRAQRRRPRRTHRGSSPLATAWSPRGTGRDGSR